MNIGEFSRGGRNRVLVKAQDHDFNVKARLTPFGFFLPQYDDCFLFFTESKVTSDFIVDQLEKIWPELQRKYSANSITINSDNGPENSSQRTQFMKRLTLFAQKFNVRVRLAYYPPYHSKYNPIERLWGIYENHMNGDMMDSIKKTLGFAKSMTYNGKNPIVEFVTEFYNTGVKVKKKIMKIYDQWIKRLPSLEKWFITIVPPPQNTILG